jgi:transmembrane sensor
MVMAPGQDPASEVTLAEAAAWLSRLQGERTQATEAAFKAWLADPAHQRAFARVTDTWEAIPGAAMLLRARKAQARRRAARYGLAAAGAAASLAALALGGWLLRGPVYATAVGQEQTLTLSDGSHVALNTDSRLSIDYSARERRVRLERGEALFEVAKNAQRPFIVQVGDKQVRAVGTKFDVRRDHGRVVVVLIEGKVVVSRKASPGARPVQIAALTSGQRLTVRATADLVSIDRAKVEAAVAWRRGEVMFDDSSLADAAAELNRYGSTQVVLGDPELRSLRVSGVFETQDPSDFARVVADLYHLRLERKDNAVTLRR